MAPYAFVSTLGAGGAATVYLVRDQETGTLHALKVPHVATELVRQRLLHEARLHARLVHPNVVAVAGVVDLGRGALALLMEYVPGPSLARLLAAEALTVEEVDALARPLLRGLATAHAAGLVHRDLKPSNILLARVGDGLVPKIADFGIARELEADATARLTSTGALLGTPQYMSPEQLDDPRRADSRSDVFSMGAVLYEMLTGRAAFEAAGPLQVMARVQRAEFTPLGDIAPALPARMRHAITTALALAPSDRHRDGAALLKAWLGDAAPPAEDVWPPRLLALVDRLQASSEHDQAAPDAVAGEWLNTAGADKPPAPRKRAARWIRAALLIALVAIAAIVAIAPGRRAPDPPEDAAGATPEPVLTRLTFNAPEEQVLGAALSPDGTKLLTTERRGAFVRESLPGRATTLQLPAGLWPSGPITWCGDGAIAISLHGSEPSTDADAWWGTPPAGPWRVVLPRGAVRACTWDGSLLLGVAEGRLVTVALPDGAARTIANVPEGAYVAQAAFSPDGAQIAYTVALGDGRWVQLVDARGTSPPRVLRDDMLPHGLAWFGDGRLVTLRARDKELDDRWASIVTQRLSPLGEVVDERVLIPRVGPAAETLSVSRAGDRLAFLTITRQRSLFASAIDGADLRQLTHDHAPAFASAWRDDETVVYSAAVDGPLDVFVRRLGAAAADKLRVGPDDEYGATPIPKSSDGSHDWLLERRAAGGDEVELVWSRPDDEVVVWSGRGTDYLARRRTRCVAAGPTCYFGVHDARGVAVSRITRAGLEPVTHLPTEPWRPIGWDISPDAERIAWSSSRGLSLRRLDEAAAQTIALDGTAQEVVWGSDGTWLLATVIGLGEHAYAIVRVDLDDHAVTVLHADVGWLSHLTLSPSAARIAWTRTRYDVVVWMAHQ